jgi:alkaline phosphatase
VNAIGVYADRTRDPFDDPRQETIGELVRRATKKSIGIVSDAELEDATPAAVVSHTRLRAEKAAIVKFFYDVKPEVLLGGGAAYFIPQSVTGSKRKDDLDYVELFSKAGYSLATTATELSQVMAAKPRKLLGLFHPENLDGVMDRKIFTSANTVPDFPDQPDLTDMTKAALDILSRNKEGFVLMVEAGLIDKFTHPMDWERAVYDTIMFDKVIGIAQEFAKKNPDTLIIVTGDHTHSISVYGTVNDNLKPGSPLRDKVGTYAAAGFPSYQDADQDGYPDTPAVPKRLAVGFGNHPDYWENFLPKLDATFAPTVKNDKNEYVANEKYKTDEAVLIAGNLARTLDATEVHSVDDMTLRASGPGSEKLKAYQENTSIFRYMVEALGIFSPKPKQ